MKPLAPAPVHYRLAPGGGLFLALAALLLILGCALLAWLLALRQAQQTGLALWVIVVALAYGGGCVWSWRSARALPCGWLVWSGKCWQLQQIPAPLQTPPTAAGQTGHTGQTAAVHAPRVGEASSVAEITGAEVVGVSAATYAACTLVLDLQRAVLLRLHGWVQQSADPYASPSKRAGGFSLAGAEAASSLWVWASRASDSAHWHALRCALVWAQTQGMQEQDRAAGGAAASVVGPVEAAESAQANKANKASQATSADAVHAMLPARTSRQEPAAAIARVAQPSQHRGTP